jgi:hypothetical protein
MRKHKATTDSNHKFNISPNLLDRNFTAAGPNRTWAGDITYIWTREGWLYLALPGCDPLPGSFFAANAERDGSTFLARHRLGRQQQNEA